MTLHLRLLLIAAGAVAATSAHAVTATKSSGESGVGVALRAGVFAGVSSTGVAANGRLNKFELEGGVMSGTQDIKSALDPFDGFFGLAPASIDKASLKQTGGYAMLKYHPMNGSFYFGFGGAQTRTTAVLEAHGSSGETLDETMKVSRTLGTISLGNVWAPEGFMIGCEWLGAGRALSSQEDIASKSSAGTDTHLSDLQTSFYKQVRSSSAQSTVNMFLVYVGVKI